MNKLHVLLLFFLLESGYTKLCAQVEDFQIWNAVSLDWKLNKEITATAEQEIRFANNSSRLGTYISVVGAEYKINSWFKVGASYRLTLNYDLEGQTYSDHRIFTDLNFRFKPGRFTLGYRLRHQIVFQQFLSDAFSNYHPQDLRHRFSAKYNIYKTPLYPFAEIELYQSLNHPVQNTVRRIKYTGGFGYPITNYANLELFYRLYDKSDLLRIPRKDYILGFSLNFSI
jgi:hypothetical protein